jgi:hypothetical protein
MDNIEIKEKAEKHYALIHDIREQTNVASMAVELLKKTGEDRYRKQVHKALRHIEELVEKNV